jgi:[ribosomal protein S5]-alanine N-acetyltransferase
VGHLRGWPLPPTLTEPDLLDAPLVLRPAQASDERAFRKVRAANDSWLRRWDPTLPEGPSPPSPIEPLVNLIRRSPVWPYAWAARRRREARQGTALSWVISYDGQFAGQLTVWHIVWGSSRSADVAYWIDERFAGRGIMPTALAMGIDHCFGGLGLHRIEAGIRPENMASRRTVEKLGFRDEGIRVRQVHIDGAWRDHVCYAITAEEAPAGLLAPWRRSLPASGSQSTASERTMQSPH